VEGGGSALAPAVPDISAAGLEIPPDDIEDRQRHADDRDCAVKPAMPAHWGRIERWKHPQDQ